jgi:hypothetical protein
MSRPGEPCALPPLERIGTSKVPILLANSHNPHLCVGSGGDQLEIPDDSILFAEIKRRLFTGRKYAFGWGEEMHHFFTEGIVCLLIVGGFISVRFVQPLLPHPDSVDFNQQ